MNEDEPIILPAIFTAAVFFIWSISGCQNDDIENNALKIKTTEPVFVNNELQIPNP